MNLSCRGKCYYRKVVYSCRILSRIRWARKAPQALAFIENGLREGVGREKCARGFCLPTKLSLVLYGTDIILYVVLSGAGI